MFIELVDTLRCVGAHEDSWLIGAFDEIRDRHVLSGELGCPICGARYPIHGGVARFGAPSTPGDTAVTAAPTIPQAVSAEDTVRLAAMLGLSAPGGLVVLAGAWGVLADMLGELVDVRVLLLGTGAAVLPRSRASAVISPEIVPLAVGSCRGVALDPSTATPSLVRSAVTVLAPEGRLVAPAEVRLPDGVAQLARDERSWVAARTGSAPLVRLGRGQGR